MAPYLLIKEAETVERLAELVSYAPDKARLREQAAQLREQAARKAARRPSLSEPLHRGESGGQD